ncbi:MULTISPECIES: chromate transporter [Paenibacillus]|uniref:chromate transporter n=1 Tax=Paenibacillus TaxID=44249 RepID=UPI0001AFD652|nr:MULTISPECIES: chromate transporter [unclassified Paenibacillus]EES71692.1 chromate transport protein [Paenibacillus sp. oral taxon 786 str. D14]OXL87556.1 chromate transporter [Paenibacillus sp. SSG-1]
MILLELFLTFLMIGFVAFGGGYAMIPLIQQEVVERHGWMTLSEFTDMIGVAGMSPGPIATNMAIFVGMHQAGLAGAVAAAIGMVLPSLVIIVAVGMVFFKIHQNKWMQSSLYGLRSVITGLILYAAVVFAIRNGLVASLSWFTLSQVLIFAGSLAALLLFRKHPLSILVISGLIGIAIYS